MRAFSLLELMVVVSIIAILAIVVVPSYRDYTVRASIASLIPVADKAKNEVEDAHNQGVIFGTSGSQTYIAANAEDKPYGLATLTQGNYGCITIGIDLDALSLDTSQQLGISFCPRVVDDSIIWQCAYSSGSSVDYVEYLPAICQQAVTSIQDTSF